MSEINNILKIKPGRKSAMSQDDMTYFLSKKWLESPEYEYARNKIRREINQNRVEIDYSVFKQTTLEKEQAFNMKQDYKRDQKLFKQATA